jgi:hypothetical protein
MRSDESVTAMRIWCVIFSFYLLLLSWQPCQDLIAKEISYPSAKARQSHLHSTPQPAETDDCSPFCVCSCCKTSMSHARLSVSVNSQFLAFAEKTPSLLRRNNYAQQHLASIWQPPKFKFIA